MVFILKVKVLMLCVNMFLVGIGVILFRCRGIGSGMVGLLC